MALAVATPSNLRPGDILHRPVTMDLVLVLRVKRGRAHCRRAAAVGTGSWWSPLSDLAGLQRVRRRSSQMD